MKKFVLVFLCLTKFVFGESTIEIHGTSTLHDWSMISKTMDVSFDSAENKITQLKVGVMIDTLKSGDEGLDEKAYEALKISKYNIITFLLKSHNEDGTITGVFKVLDQEKETTLKPDVINDAKVSGSFQVKMTEFGIEPPSVFFGTIRSGDEVTVKYDIQK